MFFPGPNKVNMPNNSKICENRVSTKALKHRHPFRALAERCSNPFSWVIAAEMAFLALLSMLNRIIVCSEDTSQVWDRPKCFESHYFVVLIIAG